MSIITIKGIAMKLDLSTFTIPQLRTLIKSYKGVSMGVSDFRFIRLIENEIAKRGKL